MVATRSSSRLTEADTASNKAPAAQNKKRESPTQSSAEPNGDVQHADKKSKTVPTQRGRKPKPKPAKNDKSGNSNGVGSHKDDPDRMIVDNDEIPDTTPNHQDKHKDTMQDAGAVTIDKDREKAVADSPILEKGLVYFFLRGKVDVEHPQSMDEVKRSYMILRPLPIGTKLLDGKVEDSGKNRLVAIPKKRLPVRGYERFLTIVEEPRASLETLKNHLQGRSYQTKTVGDRTDFPAQPVGEGVYAITKSENERQSHFVYMLTLPETPNELQREFGLKEQGSFIISVRNPKTPAPPNAGVPDPAEYPTEIMEEFRGLKWGAVHPKHMDYKNSEILFIGEKSVPQNEDHQGTADELHQLGEEDESRVVHLEGSNAIFSDLDMSKKDFLGIQTTWG